MPNIQNLPTAGAKFSARSGLGSFQKKFTGATYKAGELSVFQHHPEAVKSLINQIADKQTYIRRGGLSGAQIKKIKSEVVKSDPTLTSTGKKLIQKTLTHLSGNGASQNKPGQFIYKRNINPNVRNHNEHAITSISAKFNTATVHQVSGLTKQGEEQAHRAVSINETIKRRSATGTNTTIKPGVPTKPSINPNFQI